VISPPSQISTAAYNYAMNYSKRYLLVAVGLLLLSVASAGCAKQGKVSVSSERPLEQKAIDLKAVDLKEDVMEKTEPAGMERHEGKSAIVSKSSKPTERAETALPEITMDQLVERLKATEAIGLFTKLAIRSDVIDFKKSVKLYRKRSAFEKNAKMLKSRFDGLLLKILALLERDPVLSKDIHLARESIWKSLVGVKS